jgi:hypothetical protein
LGAATLAFFIGVRIAFLLVAFVFFTAGVWVAISYSSDTEKKAMFLVNSQRSLMSWRG